MNNHWPSQDRFTHLSTRMSASLKIVKRLLAGSIIGGLALCGVVAQAQTTAPLVLPNTFSTVAGSSSQTSGTSGFTAGSACATGSPYTATDVYGNGCPATMAVFGTDLQDGLRVDGQGNIWVADLNNNWSGTAVSLLRKIDAKTGIVTLVASSANANCTAATSSTLGSMSSYGDGCIFAKSKFPKERGWGMDPYGNLFTGSYTAGSIHIFCNAVSPLCPIAAGVTQSFSTAQKQVGYVYRIAGCVPGGAAATAGATVAAPGSGDGYFASSFWNLPGDITAWGASNSSFSATATATGVTGTCAAVTGTTGELGGGRAVVGDMYGNVFISDGTSYRVRVIVGPPSYTLPNGTVLTNPLPSVLNLYSAYSSVTAAQMYGRIYPIVGGFTATTANGACTSATSSTAADIYGSNCPWYNTSQAQTTPVGLTIDTTTEGGTVASNLITLDGSTNALRVLYMGPTVSAGSVTAATYPMANAILKNNPSLSTVTRGYVYILAGNSTTVMTSAPSLGTATAMTGYTRVAAGPNGNLYLGFSATSTTVAANVALYDLSTGYVRILIQSAAPTTYTVAIPPATSTTAIYPCATPGTGDGSAASTAVGTLNSTICFSNYGTGSSQLTLAVDGNNNLYIGDVEIDSSGYGRTRIRKVLASQMAPSTVGTATTQTLYLHGPAGTTASATAIAATALNTSSSELSVSTPACATTANADTTVDCTATVTLTPAAPGLRTANLKLTDTSLSTTSNALVSSLATGSALATDPSSGALTSNLVGSAVVPVGVAVNANGDVFTMDTAASKFTKISNGTTTQLAGTLPTSPTQIALDLAGNVFAAGVGNSTLTKLTLTGSTYVASTVTVGGVTAPQAVAFDQYGNLYVADKTTTSVYKIAAATASGTSIPTINGPLSNATLPLAVATGLSSPTSLAIDNKGNLYIGDTGANAIYRVDGYTGTQTTLISSINPVAIAVDAAGNIYYQDGSALTVVEIPAALISSGVAGTTTVTALSSLTKPSGLAVAGNGNIYSADSSAKALTLVNRSTFAYNFGVGSSGSATLSGNITNVGNLAATGTNPNVNTTNLVVSAGQTNGCTVSSGVLGAQAVGNACSFSASFVGKSTTPVAVSSAISYLPAASTVGSLTLSGTLNNISGTTTSLASLASTVLPGVSVTLTATVASTAAVSGQTVTFMNGTTTLGTATTNSSGVATYTFTSGSLGTVYVFKASFAGDGSTLGASVSATQTVTVALTPTSLSLALSTNYTYPNQAVTLTATITPVPTGESVNFMNGTTTLGSATISSTGVATFAFTPSAGTTYSIIASFPADGKVYAASTSKAQALVISSSAAILTASQSSMTITPGTSGKFTLSLTADGGYTGQVALACTSPVSYVSCALSYSSVNVAETVGFATVSVASTTASNQSQASRSGIALALLAPFGMLALLLGTRKRTRNFHRFTMIMLLAICGGIAAMSVTGCGGASVSNKGTAPTGSQVVTVTATAAGITQSVPLTISFN